MDTQIPLTEREFFIDNLLVRIHYIIVMIRWTGLAPWEVEFPFPGSLTSDPQIPLTGDGEPRKDGRGHVRVRGGAGREEGSPLAEGCQVRRPQWYAHLSLSQLQKIPLSLSAP